MKQALVISFYRSPNLGDIILSSTIDALVSELGFELTRYDFCTVRSMQDRVMPEAASLGTAESTVPIRQRLNIGAMRLLEGMLGPVGAGFLRLKYSLAAHRAAWNQIEKDMERSDIIILAGGNMMMDIVPAWPALVWQYAHLSAKCHKPFHVAFVGVGPIVHPLSRKLLRAALGRAVSISVRDSLSFSLCTQIVDTRKIVLTADPVFGIHVDLLATRLALIEGVKPSKNLTIGICVLGPMCFNLKSKHKVYLEALADLVEAVQLASQDNILFVLFSTETSDYPSVLELHADLSSRGLPSVSVQTVGSLSEVIEMYRNMNFLVGGRMHAMIIAHKCLLPHRGVVWQEKILGFGKMTGSEDRMQYVEEIRMDTLFLAKAILHDCTDVGLIQRMHGINRRLENDVRKGLLLIK